MNLQERLKNNRTRQAEIEGETVNVKVHSGKEWKKLVKDLEKFKDEDMANFLADQFTDENGKKVFTAEFLMSDDCPTCVAMELVQLIGAINSGTYKKK